MLHAIVLTTLLQLPVSQLRAAEDTPASDASFLALQVSTEERASAGRAGGAAHALGGDRRTLAS